MNAIVELCHSFGLPVWLAPLINAAKRLKSDRARRKKAYRLMQRKLMFHNIGVDVEMQSPPTYVYPKQVKMLMRAVFPGDICDYPDPRHEQVVYVTVDDLNKVDAN